MKNNPSISICIPVYNVEAYVEQCIKSVLNQDFQDFEIIVINDASPDKSMEIVERLAKDDARIMIYSNDNNMGLMWTRKEGYMRAKGDYVIFLDSDDTLPSNSLMRLYQAITTTNADIVCGQIAYITSKGISHKKYPNKLSHGNDNSGAFKSLLRWEITHNLCGKIYRRELLQAYEYQTYMNVINAEDAILFYQILCNVRLIQTIPDVVYNYYQYENSSSNIELGEQALRGIFLWQKHRFNIIMANYPQLAKELYKSITSYLTSLTPSIHSRKLINQYLSNYTIPYQINLFNIIKYSTPKIKCLLSYYCGNLVKKIRYRRLHKGGVR